MLKEYEIRRSHDLYDSFRGTYSQWEGEILMLGSRRKFREQAMSNLQDPQVFGVSEENLLHSGAICFAFFWSP
jgi:hypothetical protein